MDALYFKGNTQMLVTTLRNFDNGYRLAKNDIYNSIIADLQQGGQTPPLQIHPALFNAYADNLRKAITGVMGADARYFETSQRLQLNVTKFAAAKAYAVTQELVGARSARPDASPADFAKDAKRILNTYNRYQAAEYAAAVARARTARQWANFNNPNDIANELYPNIRWIPSRSVEPRPLHRKFWNQVWAKNDQFWNDNQPGNLWGCKCDWERTDEPPTNLHLEPIKAEPGLKGNPGVTGEVFSKDASYFQKVGTALLNQSILSLPVKDTYIPFTDKINCNVLRDAKKVPKEVSVARNLIGAGYEKIYLLPELHKKEAAQRAKFLPTGYKQQDIKKNPDAVIVKDGKEYVADFKVITNPSWLVRRIGESEGQAEYCVIKMDYDNKQDTHTIRIRVYDAMQNNPQIKGVIVLDKEGKIFYQTT
ncbi:hypothetical protein AGMMS4956_14260 [Bacteroidia bacterium]|nr:hypothetical protein AGMMS4956_14260 [Bacteroidia bacterium]